MDDDGQFFGVCHSYHNTTIILSLFFNPQTPILGGFLGVHF